MRIEARYRSCAGLRRGLLAPVLASLIFAACGGGSSEDAAAPPPPFSPTTGAKSAAIYDRAPAVEQCDPGELSAAAKQEALDIVNAMRALHGLGAVAYDDTSDRATARSALIGVANKKLSHTPGSDWYCYSAEGYGGSSTSSLVLGWTPIPAPYAIDSALARLLVDDRVSSLGHRRWLLHPFLSQTSIGRVDGNSFVDRSFVTSISLRMVGYPDADLRANAPQFVAYPFGNYPGKYFKHGWYMSFSVIASTEGTFTNGRDAIDYSRAMVEVLDPNGTALAITDLAADYSAYGLPNALQWIAVDTQSDVTYTVRVHDVKVSGTLRDYEYSMRIVD